MGKSTPVECEDCGIKIGRKADLVRHARLHLANKDDLKYACPHPGCTYRALQRSNLATHLNVHSGERPHKCPTEGCRFASSDPGSLTRHRAEQHGYEPKGRSGKGEGAAAARRKAERRQRKKAPYTVPSSASPSGSGSSVSPSSSTPCSLPPVASRASDFSPPLPLVPTAAQLETARNAFAVYCTELIQFTRVRNGSNPAPKPEAEIYPPFIPGPSTALVAPTVEHSQLPMLPMPKQSGFYAVELPTQSSFTNTPNELNSAIFSEFVAPVNNWHGQAAPAPAHTGLSVPVPTSVVQHVANHIAMPTPVSLPRSMALQYTVDNVQYEYTTLGDAQYDYSTRAVSHDQQYESLSFPALATDSYYQVDDPTYFYGPQADASFFQTRGFYPY